MLKNFVVKTSVKAIRGLISTTRLSAIIPVWLPSVDIELLMAGSQAADGAGFQLSASGSKKQIPIFKNADLNRVLNEPQYQPLPTLSIRLARVINCNTRHAGQIEYLHGLIKHQGWFPAAGK